MSVCVSKYFAKEGGVIVDSGRAKWWNGLALREADLERVGSMAALSYVGVEWRKGAKSRSNSPFILLSYFISVLRGVLSTLSITLSAGVDGALVKDPPPQPIGGGGAIILTIQWRP